MSDKDYNQQTTKGLMRLLRTMGVTALVLMVLVGCSGGASSEEAPVVVPPAEAGTPIVFAGSLTEEQEVTRAVGLETRSVTTFKAWGYKNMSHDEGTATYGALQTVMDGYTVSWVENTAGTSTTNSHDWEYLLAFHPSQTIKYWDWSARAYRFMAVTGEEVAGALGADGDDVTCDLTFTANADKEAEAPYYSRLWFSTGRYEDYPDRLFGQPVQLEFIKPLSWVRFIFIYEDPADAATTLLDAKSFRPSDGNTIKLKGKVTVSYPLTGTSTSETLRVSTEAGGLPAFTQDYYTVDDGETDLDKIANKEKWYTVLPVPTGQGTFTLDVNVNGEPKTAVVPAAYMTWMPGYRYTYIFKVHVDGGVAIDSVDSAFQPWVVEDEKPHTVYNW